MPTARARTTARGALALALCALACARAAASAHDALPRATLEAIRSGAADDAIRRAFIGERAPGAMIVTNVNARYVEARREGLTRLATCARATEAAEANGLARSAAWEDEHGGATRASMAALARERLRVDVDDACDRTGRMRGDLETLRDGADVVSRETLRRLDAAFHNATGGFFERSARSEMSLDHFHAYRAPSTAHDADDVEGKHAHTDVGVAIVMTPALILGEKRAAGGSRGLFVGDIEPDLPDDGMVVMLGEAARAWAPGLSPELRRLIKVPTHAMKLTGERAWFGRMVLPQKDHVHPTIDMSFGTWHTGAMKVAMSSNAEAESARWAAVACPSPAHEESAASDSLVTQTSRRRLLADEGSCTALGQKYCWHACQDLPAECNDTSLVQCVDQTNGQLVSGDQHNAVLRCPASNAEGFCNTAITPTTMYMDGFTLSTKNTFKPCVALLFKGWSLRTPALLALGFFATVCMGMSIEALASLRRNLQNPGFCNCHNIPSTRSRAYATSVYAVQITFGYLLMLVSMTYHVALFCAVIVGLILGHVVFGANAPVAANTTACCAHASPSDKDACPMCGPSAGDLDDLPPCCAARATAPSDSPNGSSSGDSINKPLNDRDLERGRS
ncbi:hypothetical protein BE221DRAFT_188880 [Ostreococcus tauri]|uniref:Copper transporter n=2 Tax=Ostreococcus tauri TaxID=70448 RepID=A0A1Y5IJ37_OSTTA|nr:hypothetical protein BE221DRAFT_188880 [Ostreococcus tauri]